MRNYCIFLIIIFTLNYTNICAQEKQNDASWLETVDFISTNIKTLRGNLGVNNTSTLETKISNDKTIITIKNFYFDSSYTDIRSFNLNDLGSVYLKSGNNYNYLMLWTREEGLVDCKKENDITVPCNFVEIGVDSKEMRERFFKAFKHLSYLANEKYNETKSKSKF